MTPMETVAGSAPERGLIVAFSMLLPQAAVSDAKVLTFRVLRGKDPSVATVDE